MLIYLICNSLVLESSKKAADRVSMRLYWWSSLWLVPTIGLVPIACKHDMEKCCSSPYPLTLICLLLGCCHKALNIIYYIWKMENKSIVFYNWTGPITCKLNVEKCSSSFYPLTLMYFLLRMLPRSNKCLVQLKNGKQSITGEKHLAKEDWSDITTAEAVV